MPNRSRRVERSLKMHILNRHVGSKDHLQPGRDGHQSGVVANPQGEAGHPPRTSATNPGDEICFAVEQALAAHDMARTQPAGISNPNLSPNRDGGEWQFFSSPMRLLMDRAVDLGKDLT